MLESTVSAQNAMIHAWNVRDPQAQTVQVAQGSILLNTEKSMADVWLIVELATIPKKMYAINVIQNAEIAP